MVKGVKKIRGSVMLGLAGRVFPLTVELDVRAMVEDIRKRFGIVLTEKEIENALLDIFWDVHEKNPHIADRKITTRSLGRTTFELSFCPVPIHELSKDDFERLALRTALVNKMVGT